MTSSSPSVKEHIDLTPKEKQIFKLLVDVVRYFGLKTQLRVAGGWVRDKLLGKEPHDIDIALENMYGREFCEKVEQYLSDAGKKAIQGKISVIKSNPKQSKHLETANMTLFGVNIDFANLRSEVYSESSRIPTMRFGSPEEDAFRRDLTINSLFYNISPNCAKPLEDFTGKGIEDLKAGIIATPKRDGLTPKQTFLDDPLRVLRAIRFGARLGYKLDEDLKEAASDEQVVAALEDKVSRERIGKEVDLMVSGNRPVMAMRHISELHLFGAVFGLSSDLEGYSCARLMDSASKLLEAMECCFTLDQHRLCLYGALFLPLQERTYKDEKGKEIACIFLDSLKLKTSDAERVVKLHVAAKKFSSISHIISKFASNDDARCIEVDWKRDTIDVSSASKKLRILVGLLLGDIKDFWRPALVLCCVLRNSENLRAQKKLYKMVEDWILGQGLDNIWEVKPLVDGNQIKGILDLPKGGRVVGEWVAKVVEWQLAHPSGTDQECIDWIRGVSSS